MCQESLLCRMGSQSIVAWTFSCLIDQGYTEMTASEMIVDPSGYVNACRQLPVPRFINLAAFTLETRTFKSFSIVAMQKMGASSSIDHRRSLDRFTQWSSPFMKVKARTIKAILAGKKQAFFTDDNDPNDSQRRTPGRSDREASPRNTMTHRLIPWPLHRTRIIDLKDHDDFVVALTSQNLQLADPGLLRNPQKSLCGALVMHDLDKRSICYRCNRARQLVLTANWSMRSSGRNQKPQGYKILNGKSWIHENKASRRYHVGADGGKSSPIARISSGQARASQLWFWPNLKSSQKEITKTHGASNLNGLTERRDISRRETTPSEIAKNPRQSTNGSQTQKTLQ
ncbi:hypothetical protein B0H34DRAFT_675855 [Crassisporium funariophilum]|nr:hypothetical protein B0H34DRAFT_675855 [Crassisporium funariophilum]